MYSSVLLNLSPLILDVYSAMCHDLYMEDVICKQCQGTGCGEGLASCFACLGTGFERAPVVHKSRGDKAIKAAIRAMESAIKRMKKENAYDKGTSKV